MSTTPEQDPRWVRLAFRVLLRCYPRDFRDRFGSGLIYAWGADRRAAAGRGPWPRATFWIALAAGTVRASALERLDRYFGKPTAADELIPPGTGAWLEATVRELRFALRRLGRRPGFTVAAAGTLGLGIGATAAIFSIVHAVILRPLPYPEPDRLVRIAHASPSGLLATPDGGYLYYAAHATTLERIAVYTEATATVAGAGEPVQLGIVRATPNLLSTLGVEPVIGRDLRPADAEPGAESVAVVTHGHWERHLGSDPGALGGPLVPGSRTVVVGVLPRGFDFLRPTATFVFGDRFGAPDVFLPLRLDPATARFGNFMYQGLARLAPEAGAAEAQRELDRLMPAAATTYQGSAAGAGFTPAELREGGYRSRVDPLATAIVGEVGRVLWVLLAAVGVVLAIATLNVANLFSVRAEARLGEIALQRALGAGSWATTRSFVAEASVLALLGTGIGLAVAWSGTRGAFALALAPPDVPRLDEVGIDPATVGLSLGIAFAAVVVLGLMTARHGSGATVHDAMGGFARGTAAGTGRGRVRDGLVLLQVALALVLLTGSGLLLESFRNIRGVHPGFESRDVLTVRLSLGENLIRGAGYDGADDAVRSRFMVDLTERLARLPGVERASFTGDLPFDGDERRDYVAVEGSLPGDYAEADRALRVFIGPGYLRTIGARIVEGRELEAREFADQPRSVVVNRSFVDLHWRDGDAVGRRLLQYWSGVDPDDDVWYTVVGVVDDIREAGLTTPAEPTVYLPTIFLPEGSFGMPVSSFVAVLRTAGDPGAVAPAVRAAVRDFHPEVPVGEVASLERLTARSFQQVTFTMILLVLAGVVSAALGVVGIFGTVAYAVGQRTPEFGLRVALGASAGRLRRVVLWRAARVGLMGVGLGTLGALLCGRLLDSLLYGIAPFDPAVFAAAAALVVLLVLAGSWLPAHRAATVDPAQAIRAE